MQPLPGIAQPLTLGASSNTVFFVVFGIFVAAMLVLAFLTLRWAIRRDRVGLAEWRRRRTAAAFGDRAAPSDGTVRGNGHGPTADEPPRRRPKQSPSNTDGTPPAKPGDGQSGRTPRKGAH